MSKTFENNVTLNETTTLKGENTMNKKESKVIPAGTFHKKAGTKMDRITETVLIIINVLMVIISAAACIVIVSLCRQGGVPTGQEDIYMSAMVGWLFTLILTLWIDHQAITTKC